MTEDELQKLRNRLWHAKTFSDLDLVIEVVEELLGIIAEQSRKLSIIIPDRSDDI